MPIVRKAIVRYALDWRSGSFTRQFGDDYPKTARLLARLARARDGEPQPKAKAPKAKARKAAEPKGGVVYGMPLTATERALIEAFRAR